MALFSTGDELVMPGEPLRPGAIYNSNRFTLRALIEQFGCECTDLGIVPDRLDATRDALRRAAAGNDLIVTSGGVSVGEEDHLRPAVEAEGRLDLWQIAIKPGKPLAFGEVAGAAGDRQRRWFIGLPGNPVSSFITFLLRGAAVAAAAAGRGRLAAAGRCDARRFRLAEAPTGGANSCACGAMTTAGSSCFPTRVRAC